jgi:plastocyanin
MKVTIKKGKTVTWAWNSDEKHNVTFPKRHSGTKRKADGYKLTFSKVGTFHYTCTVHGFGGKVVVVAP